MDSNLALKVPVDSSLMLGSSEFHTLTTEYRKGMVYLIFYCILFGGGLEK